MSWEKVKLKDVVKQYRIEHLVQDSNDYKQVTISKHDGVKLRGIKNGKLIGRKRQFLIDLVKYPNTLMFVRQGVEDGSIGVAPLEVNGSIATENMPMFSVENIEIDYLKLIITSSFFKNEVSKITTTGSAQKSIHEDQLLEVEIPLPLKKIQLKIVEAFSKIENENSKIITELNHQRDLVKKLKQQLLNDAVQGKLVPQNETDEPASALLARIKKEKAHSSKKEKPLAPITDAEIPFEIPINWVWCRLGEIALYSEAGKSFKCDEIKITNNEWGVIKLSAISWNIFLEDENKLYSKNIPDDLTAKIEIGDFLISRANTSELVGKSVIVKNLSKNLLLSDKTIRFKFSNFIDSNFINLFNNSQLARNYYSSMGSGSSPSMKNITRDQIKELPIPLPPHTEQKRIVEKLENLLAMCNALETHITNSAALNAQLLQQVLREALRN